MTYTLNGKAKTQIIEEGNQPEHITVPGTTNGDWSDSTNELLDSLPQLWTRGLLWLLISITFLVLPWAIVFKVDEIGTAKGRIEPKSKPIRLDIAVSGIVTKVQVKEGDLVVKGQTILLLDSESVESDLHQVKDKLEGELNRLSLLNSSKNQLLVSAGIQQQQNKSQELEKQQQVDQARTNLNTLTKSYEFQKKETLSQLKQAREVLSSNLDVNQVAKSSLESSQREVQRYQDLNRQGIVAEVNVVAQEDIAKDREKSYIQTKSNIQQARLRLVEQTSIYKRSLRQANGEIEQAKLRSQEQEKSYQTLISSDRLAMLKIAQQQKNLDTDISSLKSDMAQTKTQIQSLKFQLKQRELKSPENGVISKLELQHGAVVQQGTMVAEIAPLNSELIVRGQIPTTDSGFLRLGLPVKLKLDAYPFQDYGIIPGNLSKVSRTSEYTDTPDGKIAAYNVEITFKKPCIYSDNRCISLRLGSTVTAEIVVRQRRIIDFLLDPLTKIQHEGLNM